MQVTFEITRMAPVNDDSGRSGRIVASFDVAVFPFKIWNCLVRRKGEGSLFATLPGRKSGGVSIVAPELREAICAEAIAKYLEDFNG